MEDRIFKVITIKQFLKVKIITVFADTIESLIKRCETLLPIKDEKGMFSAIENRCTLELASSKNATGGF